MCRVAYFDYDCNRSFEREFNSLEEARAFLDKIEREGCEGFIESVEGVVSNG